MFSHGMIHNGSNNNNNNNNYYYKPYLFISSLAWDEYISINSDQLDVTPYILKGYEEENE